MSSLDDLTFLIPPLWEKEWKETIDEAEGVDKQLLLFQAHLANMLKTLKDCRITPERLAWFSLWSKTFLALDGARSALVRDSEYILHMLARASFENLLHARTVMEPDFRLYKPASTFLESETVKKSEEEIWGDVADRLRGYAAWCLWSDKQFYEELLKKDTLDKVWDPMPAFKIKNDPTKRVMHESLFGPLDIETDSDRLQEERAEYEQEFRKSLDRVGSWLKHPELKGWGEKLTRKPKTNFFALCGVKNGKVPKRLENLGLGFAYASYMQGSMLIHGSTLDSLYCNMEGKKLMPKFFGEKKRVELLASEIGDSCNQVILLLVLMQKNLWPEEKKVTVSNNENTLLL